MLCGSLEGIEEESSFFTIAMRMQVVCPILQIPNHNIKSEQRVH